MELYYKGYIIMRKFIEDKMHKIMKDFKKYINNKDKYCKLKDFRFDNGHTANYSKKHIQQYYLLKYLPAYFTEYYYMYDDIMNYNFIKDDYNILSIGCGCGIDYWACNFNQKNNQNFDGEIRYTGLDIIDWNYWDDMGKGDVYYLGEDINNMDELDEEEYNIIIFPKSIGELDNDTFNKLKEAIINTSFKCDRLIIASSLRCAKMDYDKRRTNEIIKIFREEHHYSNLDSDAEYTYFEKKDNGYDYRISDVLPEAEYPDEIKDYLTSFYKKCQGYIDNDKKFCEKQCNDVFTRRPTTTMSQVRYKITRLQR